MESIDIIIELQELVRKVREEFLKDYEENKEKYFEGDIEKIREDDWYVSRFIPRQMKKIEASVEMLKTSMRWRKEFGVPFMKGTDFPQEFYTLGGIFPYEKDRKGNAVIYMRLKLYKKISELDLLIKKYMIYILNKVDVEVRGRGIAIVIDFEGAGIANMDMDMVWFLISSLNKYYPKVLSYILFLGFPPILNAMLKIGRMWSSEEQRKLMKFANNKEILKFIDQDHLPDFLNGTCDKDYRVFPEGCLTIEDIDNDRPFSVKVIQQIKNTYEHSL